jgi:hypothetical protein
VSQQYQAKQQRRREQQAVWLVLAQVRQLLRRRQK